MNTITLTWIGDFVPPATEPLEAVEHAKREMKRKGWSQRRAAKRLGVSQEHLNRVLNGDRSSLRLLSEIAGMPPSPTPYHYTGFARKGAK